MLLCLRCSTKSSRRVRNPCRTPLLSWQHTNRGSLMKPNFPIFLAAALLLGAASAEAAHQKATRNNPSRPEAAHKKAARNNPSRPEAAHKKAARNNPAAHQKAARNNPSSPEAAHQKAARNNPSSPPPASSVPTTPHTNPTGGIGSGQSFPPISSASLTPPNAIEDAPTLNTETFGGLPGAPTYNPAWTNALRRTSGVDH
jgi:hypothetical protein